ncbi:hypothetical protein LAUMK191_01160 [Mycobacterium attenuatum]|uniref:Uncharacterized protein n=1 Tax=Mycobacterium attenuatum TaxID=2341086 RepID=A0A498PUJ1_9MYCO|nr:hypothetical protein LAUMK136_01160 [Mycobacterium attenuatum]VBA48383.1 hypothetical protein LAUMK191_01160 [Mycobacterium attenuatum]VBA52647.1 hypothetical protein LAUMK41_01221 [Mycobacterium attenuatum]
MSRIFAARLALAATFFCSIAGVAATPAAAEAPTTPCITAGETDDPADVVAAPQDTPTTSCNSEKQACMSASVQIGIYGERYVPPDAVAQCMEAYRSCIANQSPGQG